MCFCSSYNVVFIIFVYVIIWFRVQFGINLHEFFKKLKTHKCKLIPNWTRKTVWLPINNIHEKICVKDVLNFTDSELSSQFCARAKPQILIITQSRKNCAIIAPSRARAWFENKRFDWPFVNFFVHCPIRMLALLPFSAFNYLFSALC